MCSTFKTFANWNQIQCIQCKCFIQIIESFLVSLSFAWNYAAKLLFKIKFVTKLLVIFYLFENHSKAKKNYSKRVQTWLLHFQRRVAHEKNHFRCFVLLALDSICSLHSQTFKCSVANSSSTVETIFRAILFISDSQEMWIKNCDFQFNIKCDFALVRIEAREKIALLLQEKT